MMRGADPGVTWIATLHVSDPKALVAVIIYVVLEVGVTVTSPLGDTVPTPGVMVTVSAFNVL